MNTTVPVPYVLWETASAPVAASAARRCLRPGTLRPLPPHTLSVRMLGVVQVATLATNETVDALLRESLLDHVRPIAE